MANDLAEVRLWLQEMLMDTGAKSWDTGTLDNALRLALIDLSRAAGQALTLKDLDGAAATTLTWDDKGSLLIGGSAYAVRSRALDLSEKAEIGELAQTLMMAYADRKEVNFRDMLEEKSRQGMQTSGSAPHSAWEWDEEAAEEGAETPG